METSTPEYHGKCQCGAVTVVARAAPLKSFYCHCTICRRLSGAPFITAAVMPKGSVTVTGETDSYASSQTHTRLNCKVCHSFVGCLIPAYGIDIFMPSLMDKIPEEMQGSFHCYYGVRVMDVKDGKPKYITGNPGELMAE